MMTPGMGMGGCLPLIQTEDATTGVCSPSAIGSAIAYPATTIGPFLPSSLSSMMTGTMALVIGGAVWFLAYKMIFKRGL